MRERIWFWLLWASTQVGTQVGRVVGLARAARAATILRQFESRPQPVRRSTFIQPTRPHERSGLAPRRSAQRRLPRGQ